MKPSHTFSRRTRVIIGGGVVLVGFIIVIVIWMLDPIWPLSGSQKNALQAALARTMRIEMHRLVEPRATLVITNATEINAFAQAMAPRWQTPYCLCIGLTETRFIDDSGQTNIANITDEYIKFRGPWRMEVVSREYQAVPCQPLKQLMGQYERKLDALTVQPPHPADGRQPSRSVTNSTPVTAGSRR